MIAVASWSPGDCTAEPVVIDLWDMPHSLESICSGRSVLFFLCDPDLRTCREAAVHFDSQAERIEAMEIEPIFLFRGRAENVRDAVLALDLSVPVYIDPDGQVFEAFLNQKVLPAMMLLDGRGNVVRTIYGGGQSFDNNLRIILGEQEVKTGRRRGLRLLFTLLPVVVIAAVLFALD
jgi:hypothetical protein